MGVTAEEALAGIELDVRVRCPTCGDKCDDTVWIGDSAKSVMKLMHDAGFAIVPREDVADRVSPWVMHDNHTFSRLTGTTVLELVQDAMRIQAEHKDCMLCSVIVLKGKKEIRRVGPSVSLYSKDYAAGLAEWIKVVSADPDITRLLAETVKP